MADNQIPPSDAIQEVKTNEELNVELHILLNKMKKESQSIEVIKKNLEQAALTLLSQDGVPPEKDQSIQGKLAALFTQANNQLTAVNDILSKASSAFIQLQTQYTNAYNQLITDPNVPQDDSLQGKLQILITGSEKKLAEIDVKLTSLSNAEAQAKKIMDSITESRSSIDKTQGNIEAYTKELLGDSTEKGSIKNDIENIHSDIVNQYNGINELFTDLFEGEILERVLLSEEDVKKYTDENKKFYTDEKTQNKFVLRKKIIPGKSKHLEDAVSAFKIFLEKSQNEYGEAKKLINSLVPGATSAGLAFAHQTAKDRHAGSARVWSWAFLASIGLMIVTPLFLLDKGIITFKIELTDFNAFFSVFINILKMLPFELPLIWFTYFANSRVREHRRLSEEYLYKWSIATSYSGLKEQVKSLSSNDDNDKLLYEILESVVRSNINNPSDVIDIALKHDNPFLKIFEDMSSEEKIQLLKGIKQLLPALNNLSANIEKLITSK